MSSISEIEAAIALLPDAEFEAVARWIIEERHRKWDRQIESDSERGAFDALIAEVEEDISRGRTRPTDELRDNA